MSNNTYTLFCFVQGHNKPIPVTVPLKTSIGEFQKEIKKNIPNFLERIDAWSLTLWKVRLVISFDFASGGL
jgi:hypothetical protein